MATLTRGLLAARESVESALITAAAPVVERSTKVKYAVGLTGYDQSLARCLRTSLLGCDAQPGSED